MRLFVFAACLVFAPLASAAPLAVAKSPTGVVEKVLVERGTIVRAGDVVAWVGHGRPADEAQYQQLVRDELKLRKRAARGANDARAALPEIRWKLLKTSERLDFTPVVAAQGGVVDRVMQRRGDRLRPGVAVILLDARAAAATKSRPDANQG